MKPGRLDFVTAIIAGLCCCWFIGGNPLNFPVWALFFGMTWYFVGGATPNVFKMALLPAIEGYVFAAISAIVYAVSGFQWWALCLTVAVCVLLIMISSKKEPFAFTCASFNAFSIFFAGYYSGQYFKGGEFVNAGDPALGDIKGMLIAICTYLVANYIGMFAGYLCIALGVPKAQ